MHDCQWAQGCAFSAWLKAREGRAVENGGWLGARMGRARGDVEEKERERDFQQTTINNNETKVLAMVRGGTPSSCAGDWSASVHLSPITAPFDQVFGRQTRVHVCTCAFWSAGASLSVMWLRVCCLWVPGAGGREEQLSTLPLSPFLLLLVPICLWAASINQSKYHVNVHVNILFFFLLTL